MAEAHSHIGASSAYRWMNCPGSVRLYGQITERRTSGYAATGTVAHTVCEQCLRTGKEPLEFLHAKLAAEDSGITVEVDEAMVQACTIYVSEVRLDLHKFGGELRIEQSFSLEWLYPGMFGRNDASILPDRICDTLRIYDYKNGRKHVSAEGNPQCMYYALGALGKDNPFMVENVECIIIQPNAMGKDPIERWTVSADDLYAWANDELLPAAKRTEEPDAPCVMGEWCCFCEAAHLCPARQKAALEPLDAPTPDHPVANLPAVSELTPKRLGLLSAFFQSEPFTAWVKALAAEEQAQLARGVEIPGRKLVETTVLGNRRWADESAVTKEFADLGGELLTTKLKTPAQVETLLRSRGIPKAEREERISGLVTRDEATKTIVVSDDDPRPAAVDRKNIVDIFK